MQIDYWIIGLAFLVLIIVKLFWTIDLILAEIVRGGPPRRLLTSGDFWFALFQILISLLFGVFAIICFREPFRQTHAALAALVIFAAIAAALAWYWLARETRIRKEADRQ